MIGTVEAKERIWQEGDTMYYKEGVTDPDYCVLKFTAVKGRYYRKLSLCNKININLYGVFNYDRKRKSCGRLLI